MTTSGNLYLPKLSSTIYLREFPCECYNLHKDMIHNSSKMYRSISHKRRHKQQGHFCPTIDLHLLLVAAILTAASFDKTEAINEHLKHVEKQSNLVGSGSLVAATVARQAHLAEPESNNEVQRVAVGRSVRFKCTVNDIGDHKVAWFHKDRRLLLAIDNKTVAWRERIQVSSQANKVFFLQLDSVQLSDKVSLRQVSLVQLQSICAPAMRGIFPSQ